MFCRGCVLCHFASAELQPWADESVEENQQNVVENDNK